jgi:hypothetical protein
VPACHVPACGHDALASIPASTTDLPMTVDTLPPRLVQEHATFHAPTGQLHGRAGRRCTLEDGERMLDRCIQVGSAAAVCDVQS